MDGESTQRLLNEMFDVECSIDEAIEIEHRLFGKLKEQIEHYKNTIEWNSKQSSLYIDHLEAELSRYKQGVEVVRKVQPYYTINTEQHACVEVPANFIGQRVTVLVMKEGGNEH